jgi:hypothetical protein
MKLVRLIKMCLNETYSKVRIGKHLSDSFPIQNGLKQEDVLSPLLFNFALELAIRTVTNTNLIQEEIKRRLISGNSCYHLVQNLLSSRSLSKNVQIKIYKTITLPVVLYGCETWSLPLREEYKLRVFENMVLRRIF